MIATQVRLARRPEGEPGDDCFAFTHDDVPSPAEGQLLLRVVSSPSTRTCAGG
jgi:NADPH2:quinone reductase